MWHDGFLLQYIGTWYEIQKLPTSFQKDQCTTAHYTLKSPGDICVLNTELRWVNSAWRRKFQVCAFLEKILVAVLLTVTLNTSIHTRPQCYSSLSAIRSCFICILHGWWNVNSIIDSVKVKDPAEPAKLEVSFLQSKKNKHSFHFAKDFSGCQ